ncbi:SoxR reducing system RseC family protein [Pleionea sp. CnH1-48]|uniref:SoxR reducing system RseC family protein n=1 Tax=Pleionea sp. CnH1-48 TaxID=2954494 RepID=UPI002097867C|nr:SoxR reducing system RseC family protein [Pleionea sp. CnH1-48]MCO7225471.1 SoxR reducing system RseC family protein [Pleionea sp. CnH1-48]
MLKESAKVVAVDGDFAWLESVAKSGCASCDVNQTCGTGLLSQILGRRAFYTRIPNTLNAKVGEQVLVSIPEKGLLLGSFVLYLLPLLFLFATALVGDLLVIKEGWIILSSILGMMLGFGCARWLSSLLERQAITRIAMLSKSSLNISNS